MEFSKDLKELGIASLINNELVVYLDLKLVGYKISPYKHIGNSDGWESVFICHV